MQIEKELEARGQSHLLRWQGELNDAQRGRLNRQIEEIDWDILESIQTPESLQWGDIRPITGLSLAQTEENRAEYFSAGKSALQAGKLVAVLLAGGQGTRLGSSAPKGVYDIGVTRPLYIFEQLIENLKTVCKSCETTVPLLIMTSEKNDGETRAFFEEHGYFGYPKAYVRFFVQAMAPCVDLHGKILLEAKDRLAVSPNGNGGWYQSLKRAGLHRDPLLAHAEWFNVFAVDNVLQHIADPVFLGATILSGRKSGAKVVRKTRPEEKVGVLCLEDGLPSVIEYYEISERLANLRGEDGNLVYSYGVILNYLFHAETLEKIASAKIPVHAAKKKIPYLNDRGETVLPETENGYKFETLILDLIKLMGSCLPCEVEREKEFAPIKNKTGVDSVDSARELLKKNGVKL